MVEADQTGRMRSCDGDGVGLLLAVFGREESRSFSACIADVLPPKSVVGSDAERAADGFEATLLHKERNIDLLIIFINLVKKGFQV